jgi:hypothetical protein
MTTVLLLTFGRQIAKALHRNFKGVRLNVGDPIEVLHDINWRAPWQENGRCTGC